MCDNSLPGKYAEDIINIAGRDFAISLYFSLDDIELILNQETNNDAENRIKVAGLIHSHILCEENLRPSIQIIAAQDEAFFKSYVNLFLKADERLNLEYAKIDNEPNIYRHFFLAAKNETYELLKDLVKDPPDIHINLAELGKKLHEAFTVSAEMVNTWKNNLESAVKVLAESFASIQNISKTVFEAFSQIRFPDFSKEKIERLILSYKKWAQYGWTIIPMATRSFYAEPPSNQKDANKKALTHFRKREIEELFDELREMRGIKKSDLNEAILNFQNKQYKSCVMIIFSILDAKLIRLQKDEDRYGVNNIRPVGARAAICLKERIEKEHDIENKILIGFSHESIFPCLLKFYENGNDFNKQPCIANRNFIMHGMLTRPVTKKDCIQLFLLMLNFHEYLQVF